MVEADRVPVRPPRERGPARIPVWPVVAGLLAAAAYLAAVRVDHLLWVALHERTHTRQALEALRSRPPEELLPLVLRLPGAVDRGRFHAALATTRDPAHIDAILAYGRIAPRGEQAA